MVEVYLAMGVEAFMLLIVEYTDSYGVFGMLFLVPNGQWDGWSVQGSEMFGPKLQLCFPEKS